LRSAGRGGGRGACLDYRLLNDQQAGLVCNADLRFGGDGGRSISNFSLSMSS